MLDVCAEIRRERVASTDQLLQIVQKRKALLVRHAAERVVRICQRARYGRKPPVSQSSVRRPAASVIGTRTNAVQVRHERRERGGFAKLLHSLHQGLPAQQSVQLPSVLTLQQTWAGANHETRSAGAIAIMRQRWCYRNVWDFNGAAPIILRSRYTVKPSFSQKCCYHTKRSKENAVVCGFSTGRGSLKCVQPIFTQFALVTRLPVQL